MAPNKPGASEEPKSYQQDEDGNHHTGESSAEHTTNNASQTSFLHASHQTSDNAHMPSQEWHPSYNNTHQLKPGNGNALASRAGAGLIAGSADAAQGIRNARLNGLDGCEQDTISFGAAISVQPGKINDAQPHDSELMSPPFVALDDHWSQGWWNSFTPHNADIGHGTEM